MHIQVTPRIWKRKKGGGGTTALQGSHQIKKGKCKEKQGTGKERRAVEEPPHSREVIKSRKARTGKEKEEEGRWRHHRTVGKSSDQESTASRMNAGGETARCVSLVPSNYPPHSLIHGHCL
jgi:hypothetical protein